MEQDLTPEQSLNVIQEAITQAKKSFIKMSPFFITWGVALMIAGSLEFYLRLQGSDYFWVAWPAASLLGGIIAAVIGVRQGKRKSSISFMDRISSYLWGAFGVALVLVLYIAVSSNVDPNPYVMLITGIPTFVTGALLRFAPMRWGALAFWIGAIVATNVDSLYSGLIFSIALFFGYLLPGILLMRKENGVCTT